MSSATLPPSGPATGKAIACWHCGLPVPAALIDDTKQTQFCCAGCEVAYEVIHGNGLDDFYKLRNRLTPERHAAPGSGQRYAAFDTEAFQAKHTTPTRSGARSIDLRLEGVHCAACVWLVERLPHLVPGVIDARLSLGVSRARITWDPEQVCLSSIAATLGRIGYPPHPARDGSARAARDAAERSRLVRMAIAGALAGNNMLIAVALYAGVFQGIESQYATLFRWLSLVIGVASLLGPGATFFRSAVAACRARVVNLDVPIALALGVGAVAGVVNVFANRGETYFDSLSVLVFLLLSGRYLQARQQRWAEEAVGLALSMTPDVCRIVRSGEAVEESTDALEEGDTVEVRPGELFPADGVVARGESAVNQALLTGESRPVSIGRGSDVFAATQNIASTVRVEVRAVGGATRVDKLIRLVEEGIAQKPPIVQFADQVAGWFLATVMLVAGGNFAWWAATRGLVPAVDTTVAVLIVACPCALGLATPLTMAIAIGRGARREMLIKNSAVFERLARVAPRVPGHLLLDKTGTLTTGRMRIEGKHGEPGLWPWVAALEADSNHPVGRAICKALGEVDRGLQTQITDRQERHGHGVIAKTPIGCLLVGSPRFAADQGCSLPTEFARTVAEGGRLGQTTVVVALEGRVAGVIRLTDEAHSDSKDQIARVRKAGWLPEILSGDAAGPVHALARRVGLSAGSAASSGVSPEEKLARVRALHAENPDCPVVMVGDGVNDAAALAAADVGVAVHGGAEASLAAADVYLAEPGIGKLTELIGLAKETMRVARRNLGISLAYNALAVTLAVCGWITPLAAALLMPISSTTVLISAISVGRRCTGD